MAEPTPILDLTTLVVGRPVRIDGRRYTIRHLDGLTLEQSVQLGRVAPRVGHLLKTFSTLSQARRKELSEMLARMCRIVLDAPPSVQKALRDRQRMAIVQAFIGLRTDSRDLPGAKAPRRSLTGARSSRASRISTPATRPTGSAGRRLA